MITPIGLVMNQLMGHGYLSSYSRRKFHKDYHKFQGNFTSNLPTKTNTVVSFEPNGQIPMRATTSNFLLKKFSKASGLSGLQTGTGSGISSPLHKFPDVNPLDEIRFEYPFSELIVWAVLTKRQSMAKLWMLNFLQDL